MSKTNTAAAESALFKFLPTLPNTEPTKAGEKELRLKMTLRGQEETTNRPMNLKFPICG